MASTRSIPPGNIRRKLTKGVVDRLTPPAKGQSFVRDTELKGFALRVTAGGAKTFIVEKRIKGKVRRIKISRYGEHTCEEARNSAQSILGKIADGHDPVAEKRTDKARSTTLAQAFSAYLKTRKALKPRTVYGYQRSMRVHFGDWQSKPIAEITKDMVDRRHVQLGEAHGGAQANQGMRVLRAVLNFAQDKYEDAEGRSLLPENPVMRLTRTKAWYRVERRQTVIKAHQLKAWYQGVMALEGGNAAVVQDYLVFLLFTGLRREEAARLRWIDCDLQAQTLTIEDTKNRDSHVLPLPDFLYELLCRRQEVSDSVFVFPGGGITGHLVNARRQRVKAAELSGVPFTLHDLRRTFATVAESLDIPAYALKRLLNHKMTADVTAGYIVADVERLRRPMQLITDYLLSAMGVKPRGDVVELDAGSEAFKA